MASIDSRIPLQVQTPNIGGGLLQFVQMKQAKEDRAQRSKLVDLQTQQAQVQLDEFKKNAATRLWNNLSERDQARAKSVAIASAQVNALLGANDVDGAKNFLIQRQQTLEQAGIDTTETQEMLSMLEQDPKKALDASTKMVEFGQRLGFLKAPEKQDGFTLGQGQTRFDVQGKPIASVDPKSNLLSPEEEAQQARLRAAGRSQVTVNTGEKVAGAGTKKATEALGAGIGERANSRITQAFDATRQNAQLERVKVGIAKGAQTGLGEETILNLKSLASTVFGIEGTEQMGEQELMRTISNEMALRLRNPESGLGLTGNTSNKDLQFLKDSVIGLNRTKLGNLLTIDLMQRFNSLKTTLAEEQMKIIQANNGVVPIDIDSQLMKFVDQQEFLTEEERSLIESLKLAEGKDKPKEGFKFLGFENAGSQSTTP